MTHVVLLENVRYALGVVPSLQRERMRWNTSTHIMRPQDSHFIHLFDAKDNSIGSENTLSRTMLIKHILTMVTEQAIFITLSQISTELISMKKILYFAM